MYRRFTALILLFFSLSSWGQHPNRDLPFSWDNASVYFVIQDRFYNGNTSNDHSYGRDSDGNGNSYGFDQVGSFHGGDFAGLTQKINEGYFDDLGVNAIWFNAPYEQIHGWVAGRNGSFRHYAYHGYYGLDWTEMDANFGTESEFQAFVDAAHDHGIRVVMDIVMNHVGYNTMHDMAEYNYGCLNNDWRGWRPSNGENWESYHSRFIDYSANCNNWGNWWGGDYVRAGLPGYPSAGGDEKTQTLAGLPDVITESGNQVGLPPILLNKWSSAKLAQENAELDAFFSRTGYPRTVRYHFIKWLTDWVREYGIDGFRVDTEKHVEGEAWKHLKDEAKIALQEWKANNPSKKLDDEEFWMVGENFGYGYGRSQYHIDNGFDGLINFAFQDQAGNLGNLDNLYSDYANQLNTTTDWNALSYISSHDTHLFDRGNLMDAGTSLLLLPGGIQIFYGDETGRPVGPGGDDPEQGTRSFMNWNSISTDLLEHWQKLGQFRRNHLSVGGGSHQKIGDGPYTFKRELGSDKVIVAIGANGSTTLNVSSVFPDGAVLRDFYTAQESTVSGGSVTFNAHSNGVILVEEANPVDRPILTVNPASGYDPDSITMTASAVDSSDPNPTIYFTSNPAHSTAHLEQWNIYTTPVTFHQSVDLRVVAQNSSGELSSVISRSYSIGAIDGFTVYLQNPDGWGQPYVYYWGEDPNVMPDVAWPGEAMLDDGNGWYRYEFPGVLNTNLIFNNNGSPQTEDLVRDRDGWYVNGQWLDEDPRIVPNEPPVLSANPVGGTFEIGETVNVTLTATDDSDSNLRIYYTLDGTDPHGACIIYDGPIPITSNTNLKAITYDSEGLASNVVDELYTFEEPSPGMTIYYKGPIANPYIYYWNTTPGNESSSWPGFAMGYQNGWHYFTFQEATCANVIFSNSGASQTADLYRCGTGWYYNGQWYDQEPNTSNDLVIHYKPGWYQDPEIYFWNVTPGGHTTSWPGVTMTSEGNGWYQYVLPNASCANVIFNNNGNNQTADLYRCGEGWYENGQWFDNMPGARVENEANSGVDFEPMDFSLYPNPSSGSGKFEFSLSQDQEVSLAIYDLNGKLVKTLSNRLWSTGTHQLEYTLEEEGLYIYRFKSIELNITGKLLIR